VTEEGNISIQVKRRG